MMKKFSGYTKIIMVLTLISMLNTPTIKSIDRYEVKIYGTGCSKCVIDYGNSISNIFDAMGYEDAVETYYLYNYPDKVLELENYREKLNVPLDLQGKIATIVNEKYVFEGYVPNYVIRDFIERDMMNYNSIIVSYDGVHEEYKIVLENGIIKTCNLERSLEECIEVKSPDVRKTLSLIVVSGFLDGINPCAFTVLLFYTAFLVSINQTKDKPVNVRLLGGLYIASIFVSYMLIGLTLYEFIYLLPYTNLLSTLGSIIIIIIGLLYIKDHFIPNKGPSIRISQENWDKTKYWMRKTSIPATVIAGLLIGLFEFPCTGGIYLGIITMLNSKTRYTLALFYLIIYNIAFIIPLLALFIFSLFRGTEKFSIISWKNSAEKRLRLVSGIIYLSIGILLYILQ
jgi:cytochrome c biogenesis protein CcdA